MAVLGLVCSAALYAQPKEPTFSSPAAVRAAAGTAEEAEVKRVLQERFPGLEVTSISKSPYFGLYEIFAGDQIVYTDAKVTYVLVGTVIDPITRVNLTEERLQALKAINVADLPMDQAIKIVRGKGERKFFVFSDADCPYCKQLEKTLAGMDNFTAYVLLYPIDQLHPDAARKSKKIWCSADRPKAWLEFMLKGNLPANDGICETPLPQLQALAKKYHVVATPTLVFMDGRVVPGALPQDRLEKELARADTALKTAKN
ncbi:MAG: DsbC family protein [Acidobacteriota bacterium]